MSSFLHWLDAFVRSPGFGGLAAVVAAAVAYKSAKMTANKQDERAKQDRDQQDERAKQDRDQQREISARDRWWDQAKWTFDRLDNPETQASALEAFDALLDRAKDDPEVSFVAEALRPGLDPDVVKPSPTPKEKRFRTLPSVRHTKRKDGSEREGKA